MKKEVSNMEVFEIKTNRSDYPFIVIANGFKKAVQILYGKGIYDSNIISVNKLDSYKSEHILIEQSLVEREHLRDEVIHELQKTMPHWKKMSNGAAGGGDREIYLIRSSKGYYFTSSCIGGDNYYLELDSLEQLPGISESD